MINRTLKLIVCLLITIPLGEAHTFFYTPELRERDWFLLVDVWQDIEWYVKDNSEAITWIIFLSVWFIREKLRSSFFANVILWFLTYRILDLFMYWVNKRHGGFLYASCVYGVSLLLVILNYNKWRIR